ncbi:MAG: hypothetical protein ACK5LE_00125 [Alphaproteobacteria bacterium]
MRNHRWINHLKADRKQKIIHAYKDFKESEMGQIILKDLARYCCFNHTSFNGENSHLTAFNEGARDVFLHILELSNIQPQSLLQPDDENI